MFLLFPSLGARGTLKNCGFTLLQKDSTRNSKLQISLVFFSVQPEQKQTMDKIYIFRINNGVVLDPDKFTLPFAKSKINCPRCRRCIEKAEKLLTDRPLVNHQDIPSVCDHCWRQLVKIQKLVQRAQKKNSGAEGAALSAQMLQATGIDENQTKEPKQIKEATSLKTSTSRIRLTSETNEGKTKSKKLTDESISVKTKDKVSNEIAQEEPLRTKDKDPEARNDKLKTQDGALKTKNKVSKAMAQEEALWTKNKGSKPRDDKSITQEEALKTKDKVSKAMAQEETLMTKNKDSEARDVKSKTQEVALKTKDKLSKAIAQEEALLTKDKGKARDNKSITQGEALKTKDKGSKAIPQEEALRTKYKGSESRDDKSLTQKEALKTKDKQTKAIVQEEAQRIKNKGSKARDDKSLTQEEALTTKDKVTKPIVQEEAQRTKDKGSKARDGKSSTQEEALKTKDKETKAIGQEEEQRSKVKESKTRDDKSITKEEALITKSIAQEKTLRTKDKGSKAKENKSIVQEEALKTKDKVTKSIAQEEGLLTKDKGSKARDNKSITQEEALKTKDKITKAIEQEEELISKVKESKTRDDKSITQEEALILKAIAQEKLLRTKDKGSKANDDKSVVQEEALKTKDKRSKAKDEKSVAQEDTLKEKDKQSKVAHEKTKAGEKSLAEKSEAKNQKRLRVTSSVNLLIIQIAQEKLRREKEKLEADNIRKQQEQEKKSLELAEKMAKEAVLKLEKEKLVKQIVLPVSDSEDNVIHDYEQSIHKALVKSKIIIGDKICNNTRRDKGEDLEITDKISAQKLEKYRNVLELETPDKGSVDRAKKGGVVEEALLTKDKKSNAKDEKSVAQEDTLKEKGKQSKITHEKTKAGEESLAEKSEAKNQKRLRVTSSVNLLIIQIAQEKLRREKEKLEADNIRKQQEQEKKSLELTEKMAKEAVLKLEKEKLANQIVLPVSDSEDTVMHDYEQSLHKALVISEIIMGEKICNNTRRDKGEELKITEKISAQKLEKYRNVLELETPEVDRAKKGAVVESEKTEKATVEGLDKHEKTKRKSIQNSKKAKATKSAIDHIQNKKEDCTIRYSLSDRTFIAKGWTMLPLEKVVRKMNVYRMRPSKPEFDWFERHKNKALEYDSGERLAEVDGAGRGRWYYRSGALAMDYYDAEETGAGRRFVVYSSGAPDALGRPRPRTVLAAFDQSGNGIVFDHAGKTRLKYNQTEGVVLDREIGPVSRWQWHSLNDPPVLQQVMLDTQLGYKDPDIAALGPAETPRPEDEAMLSIELDNFVKEKMKKSSQNFKPFQIKMKALKINENFSLRVLDQASVYLSFRDGSTKLKINIGMLIDHKEIVDTDIADISDVSTTMEKLPAHTASIAQLQQSVARARARAAAERAARARLAGCPEGRLGDIDSVDALRKAISRPPRTPLITCSASVTHGDPELHKPCFYDLYCKPLF